MAEERGEEGSSGRATRKQRELCSRGMNCAPPSREAYRPGRPGRRHQETVIGAMSGGLPDPLFLFKATLSFPRYR